MRSSFQSCGKTMGINYNDYEFDWTQSERDKDRLKKDKENEKDRKKDEDHKKGGLSGSGNLGDGNRSRLPEGFDNLLPDKNHGRFNPQSDKDEFLKPPEKKQTLMIPNSPNMVHNFVFHFTINS